MVAFNAIIGVLFAVLMIWLLYSSIKNKPELFTAENINKSLTTVGLLTLALIASIAAVVIFLRG